MNSFFLEICWNRLYNLSQSGMWHPWIWLSEAMPGVVWQIWVDDSCFWVVFAKCFQGDVHYLEPRFGPEPLPCPEPCLGFRESSFAVYFCVQVSWAVATVKFMFLRSLYKKIAASSMGVPFSCLWWWRAQGEPCQMLLFHLCLLMLLLLFIVGVPCCLVFLSGGQIFLLSFLFVFPSMTGF